jgi:phytoene dehydrogenase-like protein
MACPYGILKAAAEYENLFKEKAVQIITGTSVEEILVDEENNGIGAKLNNGQKSLVI